MITVACVVIASLKRRQLLDDLIMPSVIEQGFDEVVVVGDFHSGEGWRHLPFRPVFGNTIDAQWKRDVGAVATRSSHIVYLCDDHRLHPDFSRDFAATAPQERTKTIVVPTRFTVRDGKHIGLNMGWPGYMGKPYAGGHCGIFPRIAIESVPWGVAPLHPNWDFFHTQVLLEHGFTFTFMSDSCFIEDIEPGAEPWL
jgi:hypothetical protein